MMQMYLQKGYYGGTWFLQPQAVALFNTCNYCSEGNRRGLGVDKNCCSNFSKRLQESKRFRFIFTRKMDF